MRPAVAELTSGPAALLHHHPRLDLELTEADENWLTVHAIVWSGMVAR
jgi:hypothetical protein